MSDTSEPGVFFFSPSFNKICPDRQLTYQKFAKLVRIPALTVLKKLANPVRFESRRWSEILLAYFPGS